MATERFEELKGMMEENVACVAEDHPVAVSTGLGVLGLAFGIAVSVLGYRFVGKTAGKAAAKELIDSGVWLGYTHP